MYPLRRGECLKWRSVQGVEKRNHLSVRIVFQIDRVDVEWTWTEGHIADVPVSPMWEENVEMLSLAPGCAMSLRICTQISCTFMFDRSMNSVLRFFLCQCLFILETIRTSAMRVIHVTVMAEETPRLRVEFVLYCPT